MPLAAGIPRRLRLIYCPMGTGLRVVKGLERSGRYSLTLVDPITGTDFPRGEIAPDASGNWAVRVPGTPAWFARPIYQDWLLVLTAEGAGQ